MPISGEYSWTETASHVLVLIPLKGHKASQVDIYASEKYLKISFPPYLIEIFPKYAIVDHAIKATHKRGTLQVKIAKKVEQIWGNLVSEDPGQEASLANAAGETEKSPGGNEDSAKDIGIGISTEKVAAPLANANVNTNTLAKAKAKVNELRKEEIKKKTEKEG